jgi:hypothetical protein
MFARRLALFAAIGALAGPAAAQQPVTLPLRDARAIVIVDAWEGYSAISPIRATYTLARAADGSFAGTVRIGVGNGLIRRDTSFAARLPRAAADSLLQELSEAGLQEGSYRPTFTHTDDYPEIRVDLTVGGSVIRFHTTSQGGAHVPWQVHAGRRTYVSGSERIWLALSAVLHRLGETQKRALMEAAEQDPETQCNHARLPQPWLARRPRYAAGEAWFARDSVITVQGRNYRRYGIARVLGLHEISPYASYRGVPVLKEAGLQGTPDFVYLPVRAICEVQPFVLEPRP